MARLKLVLVLHNHQPHGNFGHVLARATARAYGPMLDALSAQPHMRLGLHYSGTLLDWLAAERPGLVEQLAALVHRGQVELLTGGYHEPILPVVPAADRRGQILALTERITQRFGTRPTGLWLTERVWEPGLAYDLASAGIHYTIVDDSHFQLAGIAPEALHAPYVTEDGGRPLTLLASLKELRYRLPWHDVPELMAWLREAHARGAPLAVMGDDGEKLGLWPRTYDLVWRRGWWSDFAAAVADASDWLTPCTPSEALAAQPPAGRVYLPTASYDEMGEWALPPAAAAMLHAARARADAQDDPARPFLAGTAWRGFLARYPEANLLHKRMLWAARRVHALPPGPARSAAEAALWQGQSNCPYWHGVFGGLYLVHLRTANWAALALADSLAGAADPGRARPRLQSVDFDADGRPEIVAETEAQLLVIAPHDGGTALVWEDRRARCNLVFALARRREAYHARLEAAERDGTAVVDPAAWAEDTEDGLLAPELAAEAASIHTDVVRLRSPGLARLVREDPAPRWAFRDRWLPADAAVDDLVAGDRADIGGLFGASWQAAVGHEPSGTGPLQVRLETSGLTGDLADCRLTKRYIVAHDEADLVLRYSLAAPPDRAVAGRLAVETSWCLAGGGGPDARLRVAGKDVDGLTPATFPACSGYTYTVVPADVDISAAVTASTGEPELWTYPIETAASSDAGFERSWQGLAVVVVWPVMLAAGAAWQAELRLQVAPASGVGLGVDSALPLARRVP